MCTQNDPTGQWTVWKSKGSNGETTTSRLAEEFPKLLKDRHHGVRLMAASAVQWSVGTGSFVALVFVLNCAALCDLAGALLSASLSWRPRQESSPTVETSKTLSLMLSTKPYMKV